MFKQLRKYLDKRYVIRTVGSFDETGLVCAVEKSEPKSLVFLLHAGINPNANNERGIPAICLGVQIGNIPILKILLENGADLDIQDKKGKTALIHAAESGNKHVLNFILEQNPELEIADHKGETALWKAAEIGKTSLVQDLLEAGVEVDISNFEGVTPLMTAIDHMRTGAVKALIEADADPTLKDKEGLSALDRPDLSPRITKLLKEAARKHKQLHLRTETEEHTSIPTEPLPDIRKQISDLGGFILGMVDTTIQNLDRNGMLEEWEQKGKDFLEQLNKRKEESASRVEEDPNEAFLQENIRWFIELLLELKKIGLHIRSISPSIDPSQQENLLNFQQQISFAVHQFADFLSRQTDSSETSSSKTKK